MKKINLSQEKHNALQNHVSSQAVGVKVIKEIFDFYVEDLQNIENVDPKGNMGLQSLARQEALKTLKEVRGLVFPEYGTVNKVPEPQEKISQYR